MNEDPLLSEYTWTFGSRMAERRSRLHSCALLPYIQPNVIVAHMRLCLRHIPYLCSCWLGRVLAVFVRQA